MPKYKMVDHVEFLRSFMMRIIKNVQGTLWCNQKVFEKVSVLKKIELKNTRSTKWGSLVCFRGADVAVCSGHP